MTVQKKYLLAPVLTAFPHEGIEGQTFIKTVWVKYGVTGVGGQDQFKGKIFRIATLGYTNKHDVITGISDFEFTLKDQGYKFQMCTGVAKTLEVLTEI